MEKSKTPGQAYSEQASLTASHPVAAHQGLCGSGYYGCSRARYPTDPAPRKHMAECVEAYKKAMDEALKSVNEKLDEVKETEV